MMGTNSFPSTRACQKLNLRSPVCISAPLQLNNIVYRGSVARTHWNESAHSLQTKQLQVKSELSSLRAKQKHFQSHNGVMSSLCVRMQVCVWGGARSTEAHASGWQKHGCVTMKGSRNNTKKLVRSIEETRSESNCLEKSCSSSRCLFGGGPIDQPGTFSSNKRSKKKSS